MVTIAGRILKALDHGPMTATEIWQTHKIGAMTTTRSLLVGLEAEGLVKRTPRRRIDGQELASLWSRIEPSN